MAQARLTHQDLSEIYIGQFLRGKVGQCDPQLLTEPFSGFMTKARKSKKALTDDDAINLLGVRNFDAAIRAAESVHSIKTANWLMQLEQAYAQYITGTELEQIAKRMIQGEVIEREVILAKTARLSSGHRRAQRLDKITPDRTTFIKTGFLPIDDHIGGIVEHGLTIIGGRPGLGKTWLLCLLAVLYVTTHKGRKAILFTFEMTGGQLAHRLIDDMQIPAKYRERIYICDDAEDYEDALSVMEEDADYHLGLFDYAELMLGKAERSPQNISMMNYALSRWATRRKKSLVQASQLNRFVEAPNTNGNSKKMSQSRLKWGGEDAAALIMLLMSATDIADISDLSSIPLSGDVSGIAFVKSRFSYGRHKRKAGVVVVPWNENGGWTNAPKTDYYPIRVRD